MHATFLFAESSRCEVSRKQKVDLKDITCAPFVSLYLDIELLSKASCLTLYTSSNWSSKKDLSRSSETEILFQGQVVGGRGHGSPVSSHLPLMYPHPNSLGTQEIPLLLMSETCLSHKNPQDFYWSCLLLCRTAIVLLSYINQYPCNMDTVCSSCSQCMTSKV